MSDVLEVSFRPRDTLEKDLRIRTGGKLPDASRLAERDLGRYYSVLFFELKGVAEQLTAAEALHVCLVLADDASVEPAGFRLREVPAPGVDLAELVRKVGSFTPGQRFALIDATERWRALEGDPAERLVWVGLQPDPLFPR